MNRLLSVIVIIILLVGCKSAKSADLESKMHDLLDETKALRLERTSSDSVAVVFPLQLSIRDKEHAMDIVLDSLKNYGIIHIQEVAPEPQINDSFWGLKKSRIPKNEN